ncbi:diguanylate cyclase [Vibrio sp. HN007]|uniref:sensor domain-containing diguanylate cyclase n=1 Tax=Vibrio iocasae TaxID=3098914 RepID=UPI0035D4EBCD
MSRSLKTKIIDAELPKAVHEASTEITLNILPAVITSSVLANDKFILDWLKTDENQQQEIVRYLANIKTHNNATISFMVSAKTQQYYNSEGFIVYEKKGDPMAQWYFDFIAGDNLYELNLGPNIDKAHTPTLFINHKMIEDGKLVGVIGLGLELKSIESILSRFSNQYKQNIYFIDNEGQIVSKSQGGKHTSDSILVIPDLKEAIAGNPNEQDALFEHRSEDQNFLISLRYLPQLKWWMMVEQEEGLTFTEVDETLFINIIIGVATILFTLITVSWVINFFHKQLEEIASTDTLTGLYNRQMFEQTAKKAMEQCSRNQSTLSLLMIDIDRFKSINDEFGHLVGDKALKCLAETINSSVRKADIVGRWGGEEFVVIAYNTHIMDASYLADKIRVNVEETKELPRKITVSVGVTEFIPTDSLESLLDRADQALYTAKNDGRNCVRTV